MSRQSNKTSWSIGSALIMLVTAFSGLLACAETNGPQASPRLQQRVYVDDPSCPKPRCFELRIPHPETVVVSEDRVRVILPAAYEESDQAYPIIYLLHDAPGNYLSWTQLGEVYESLAPFDVIVVMPDGGGGNPGWYSDWLDGSFHWESFHIQFMMPYIESQFRVLGDGHRAIAGPSMGGFGSMSYAARYPGYFATAAGFSGAVDFLHLEQISALYAYLGNPIAGTPDGPIWGDPVARFDVWQAHDPGSHILGFAGMKVLLAVGNGQPGGPYEDFSKPQLYAIEPLVEEMNRSLAANLAAAGIEHETWFYGPGFHDWPYYREAFAWAWPQMYQRIREQN